MDAEVYPDDEVESFISEHYVPVKIHIKEQPETFERFGAQWTPTLMVVDADGTEHHRLEGFLPKTEFLSQLALGLARAAFDHGRWEEAEAAFDQVLQDYPDTEAAPEALYWRGVTRYKASDDAADLTATAEEFQRRYTDTPWARKASVWAG